MAVLKIQTVIHKSFDPGRDTSEYLRDIIHRAVVESLAYADRHGEAVPHWLAEDTEAMVEGVKYSNCYAFTSDWVPEELKSATVCEFTIEVRELTARKVRALNKIEAGIDLVRRFSTDNRP